jgi:poly(ADP-ribose) glycohydrolase
MLLDNSTILFHLPFSDENDDNIHPPSPHRTNSIRYSDWNRDHVRLPCCSESKIMKTDENGKKELKSRWEVITKSLKQPIKNSYDLEKAIKNYNEQYANVWDFSGLHNLFQQLPESESDEFFNEILPKLIDLALQLPELIQCPIPLLKQGMNSSISMSQQQASCLLVNAFFCTFPYRNKAKKHSDYANYPEINFNRLFFSSGQKVIEKLKCILNYFRRIVTKMPCGVITYLRKSKQVADDWEDETKLLSSIKYHISNDKKIEEAEGMLQVDFANKFIGGGVLGSGCVQEEIRFIINPELIVAKLFTECLEDNEAFLVIGCEQFNSYSGYASTFKFDGNFVDKTPMDIYRRKQTRIVAIDALNYSIKNNQFDEKAICRDLNKAFVGFTSIKTSDSIDSSPLATGCWGCGAFAGNSMRAALIQLMACCRCERNMAFFTFRDELLKDEIHEIFELLINERVTIGELAKILRQFNTDLEFEREDGLQRFIRKRVSTLRESSKELSDEEELQCVQIEKNSFQQVRRELVQSKLFDFQKPSSSSNDFERVRNVFDPPKPEIPKTEMKSSSLLDFLDDDYKQSK